MREAVDGEGDFTGESVAGEGVLLEAEGEISDARNSSEKQFSERKRSFKAVRLERSGIGPVKRFCLRLRTRMMPWNWKWCWLR